MAGFENMSPVPAEKKKPEISSEDQAVMRRRNFLKAAGAAALTAAAPEVLAAPERGKENVTLRGFDLSSVEKEVLVRKLEQLAPGARAEFTMNGPGAPVEGHRFIWVNVLIILKDGTDRTGKGTAFYPATPSTIGKITREALKDAFEQR